MLLLWYEEPAWEPMLVTENKLEESGRR
jgi:hypothetical protein